MIQQEKCPHCGERTIPKAWLGLNPPHCDKCGKPAWDKDERKILC